MLVFNDTKYTEQRVNVKPLSLEDAYNAIVSINVLIVSSTFRPFASEIENLQNFIWEYENLKHQQSNKRCECIRNRFTSDIDVNYEIVKCNE